MIQGINLDLLDNGTKIGDSFLDPIKEFLENQKQEMSNYQTEDLRPSC
jgi:hypothetical protein